MIELSIVAIIVVVFIILWNMDKPQKQETAQQPKEPAKEKNKYDPNAIAIHHRDGKLLGYIPADQTDEVREITNSQFPFEIFGDIEDNIDYDDNRHYHTGIIHLEIKSKK